nr:hypothetical protein B0A51_00156 [Rachicladosporium sp. CCFEE 5018]
MECLFAGLEPPEAEYEAVALLPAFTTLLALFSVYAQAAPLSIPKHNEIKDGKPKDLEERQLIESVVGLGLGTAAITTAGLTVGLLDKRDAATPISTHDEIRDSKPKDLETRQLIESVVGLGVGGAIITAAGLTVGLLDKKDVIEAGRQRRHLANPAPIITTSNTEPNSTNVTLIRYADMSNSHRHPGTGIQEPIGVPKAYAVDAKGHLVEESHRPAYGTCFAQRNEGYHHYCADLIKNYGSAGPQSGGVQTFNIDLKHGGRPRIQTGTTPSANGTYFASITPTGPGLRSNRPVTMKDGELFTTGNATVVPGRKVWIEPTRKGWLRWHCRTAVVQGSQARAFGAVCRLLSQAFEMSGVLLTGTVCSF